MSVVPFRNGLPVYIRKGSIYKCEKCKEGMYRAERDLCYGETTTRHMFFNIQANQPTIDGEIITCLNCGVIPLSKFGFAGNWSLE